MKRYKVIFTDSAREDIFKSYEWVVRKGAKLKPRNGLENYEHRLKRY